jgi:plastocyanin
MRMTRNPAPHRRRIGLVLGAVAVIAPAAAALPELTAAGEAVVAAAASPATVDIDNFAFTPATLTVTAGATVTWKNEGDSPDRIGDKDGTFKSAALDTDDTFSHTFAAPGEYAYICTIHPYMVGNIITWSETSSSNPPASRETLSILWRAPPQPTLLSWYQDRRVSWAPGWVSAGCQLLG